MEEEEEGGTGEIPGEEILSVGVTKRGLGGMQQHDDLETGRGGGGLQRTESILVSSSLQMLDPTQQNQVRILIQPRYTL